MVKFLLFGYLLGSLFCSQGSICINDDLKKLQNENEACAFLQKNMGKFINDGPWRKKICAFLVKNNFRAAINFLLENIYSQEDEVILHLLGAIQFLFDRVSPQTHLASFQDMMGNTILYYLFSLLTHNDQDDLRRHALEILVQAGCNPYCKNNFGQSFFDLIQNFGTESEKYFFDTDLSKRLLACSEMTQYTTEGESYDREEEQNSFWQSQVHESQETPEVDYNTDFNTVIVERESPLYKNEEEEQSLAVDEKKKIENLIRKNMPALPQASFSPGTLKQKKLFHSKKNRNHKTEILGEVASWVVPSKLSKKKGRCTLS